MNMVKKPNLFSRLKNQLSKTRTGLLGGLSSLLGKQTLDEEVLEELETRLLMADVGIEATEEILSKLSQRVARGDAKHTTTSLDILKDEMTALLKPYQQVIPVDDRHPFAILVVGINGVGKTTTIGKLTHHYRQQGRSVLLAAGDTFRAAAVEQLRTWSERTDSPLVSQGIGADAASVIYDGYQAAQSRGIDIFIADTAGRLHTKSNLMEELKKISRVIKKLEVSAPHEVLLVLDATTGQNALNQAIEFHRAVGLSGLILTKLDGTAKGGIVFALSKKLQLPLRFIGVGEGLEDLQVFDAEAFVEALLADGD
ncbi:MAG: signal recognition particle-docking protein FtsY [Candidatus Competibacterales bacterium]